VQALRSFSGDMFLGEMFRGNISGGALLIVAGVKPCANRSSQRWCPEVRDAFCARSASRPRRCPCRGDLDWPIHSNLHATVASHAPFAKRVVHSVSWGAKRTLRAQVAGLCRLARAVLRYHRLCRSNGSEALRRRRCTHKPGVRPPSGGRHPWFRTATRCTPKGVPQRRRCGAHFAR
jgi:hypothetical protein